MNDATALRFGKGVKLHRDPDGSAMLLIPEGALTLNHVATVALELIDGKRTIAEITDAVVERFDVTPERARDNLRGLFERLHERGFVQ